MADVCFVALVRSLSLSPYSLPILFFKIGRLRLYLKKPLFLLRRVFSNKTFASLRSSVRCRSSLLAANFVFQNWTQLQPPAQTGTKLTTSPIFRLVRMPLCRLTLSLFSRIRHRLAFAAASFPWATFIFTSTSLISAASRLSCAVPVNALSAPKYFTVIISFQAPDA